MKEKILSGEYGDLLGVRGFVTWNRTADYYREAPWKGSWATEGGGALINQAIHTLDLIVGFLGMPDRIEGTMRNHHLKAGIEVEDTAEIFLSRDGVPALLYASNAYSQDAPVIIEAHLEKAALRLENDTVTVISGGNRQEILCQSGQAAGRAYWGACHQTCIADFYRSVETGAPFQNSPASCGDTMKTLFELYAQCRPRLSAEQ